MVKLDLKIHELAACVRAPLETSAQDIDRKAIRLEFVDAVEPLFVETDSDRLQQVFRNIISNAVKFTPAGGAIRVAITREPGGAKVVVADTGVGIMAAFLPFVFDMFRQQEHGTRREYEGLGIGLALVKKLIELQKGSVSVTSAGTGREGLDMVRDAEPDLVRCDLRMPRMDGFEFIRELHRATAHPPVVAMTALASDTDRQRTREAGFEGHINKPFDEAAIVAAVDAALHPPQDIGAAVKPGAEGRG